MKIIFNLADYLIVHSKPAVKEIKKNKKFVIKEDFIFRIATLICSILVWIKIKDFGTISYVVSIMAGIIIVILPILIFGNK